MSLADERDAKAYELVRVQGLSLAAAGKMLGENKGNVRSAVTREAVRRARVAGGHAPSADTGDAGFLAAVLGPGPHRVTQPPTVVVTMLDADGRDIRDTVTPPADRLYVAPPEADDDLELDVGAWLQRQIKKLERHIDMLHRENNIGEAQKHTRTLAGLAAELRKYNKETRDDAGVMHYTLEDVAKAEAELDAMAADTAHRPFVCAECGRAMRRKEAAGE